MKEKYKGERVLVSLTKKEISQIKNGKIINGHKVDVEMEEED